MQLLVRTPQLHQLPVIVIALMRRRRERPPQRLHLRCMRTLSSRELNLRLRGRICHLGAPEPFRSGIVVECLAKLSLEILDVLRRLCSRIQGSARVAYLLSEWPSKSQPICNQSQPNLNQSQPNLNQSQPISTHLNQSATNGPASPSICTVERFAWRCTAHLPELAIKTQSRLARRCTPARARAAPS